LANFRLSSDNTAWIPALSARFLDTASCRGHNRGDCGLSRPASTPNDWKKPVRTNFRTPESNTKGTTMFAVMKTGGKQYRVSPEDVVQVARVKGEPGEIVQFGEVLVVGGDAVTLGGPTVSGASVAAEVLQHGRGEKVIAFKKRRRKNSRRKRGHRQEFTMVRITEILTEGATPSVQARPKAQPKPAKPETDDDEAAETAADAKAASKPSARATGKGKKPASKKPAPRGKSKT
jgi:large subunit ribosomal protein L21